MRGSHALAHRCRPSNNVPPSRLFSIRTLAALHRPATVARTVCYPCLARLKLSLSGRHGTTLTSYHAAASFHSSAAAAYRDRGVPRDHGGQREAMQPSRMRLSEPGRVARGNGRGGSKHGDWQDLSVETGGGMNRRNFKPRPDDKRQYSRETLRRQQDLRDATSRPSPSRFQQRPTTDFQAERKRGLEPRDFIDRDQRLPDRSDRFRGDRDTRDRPSDRNRRGDQEFAPRNYQRATPRNAGPIDSVRAERRQLAEKLDAESAAAAAARREAREAMLNRSRERPENARDFDRQRSTRQSRDRPDGRNDAYAKSNFNPRGNRDRDRNVDPERAARRALADKIDSEQPERSAFTRPPTRRFAQMKQIATLDHVSSRAREITHAAEQRFSSFDSFGFLPQTIEALHKDGLQGLDQVEPTPVQSLVIPKLLNRNPAPSPRATSKPTSSRDKRKNAAAAHTPPPTPADDDAPFSDTFQTYLVAAETGSGKTLAYVLPLMDTLKRRELAREEEAEEREHSNRHRTAASDLDLSNRYMYDIDSPPVAYGPSISQPFAVILVPTSELVLQVGMLIKKLSYSVKLRSEMISRDFTGAVIRNRLFGRSAPLDIIVGTPFMIDRITEANPDMLARTSHIVIDEADSLFDRSFSPLTSAIIPRAVNLETLVLCSATIPKSLDAYVTRKFPNARRLVTANLHAIPRRVAMQVVNVEGDPYRGNKMLACAALLDDIAKDATEPGYRKRVVVFVNERETTAPLTAFLAEKGFDAVEINRDSDSRRVLESFTGDKEPTEEDAAEAPAAVRRGSVQVLVTTDLASRGVDTKNVRNVVLYDVPYTSIDFIHRLGRTGRMGRRGRAWVLVDKSSNEAYVKEVKKTMHLGQALI